MKYVSLGIPLQKHVSLRFLFISSKQEDNWNPSWVTVMFPAAETDRSSKAQRTLKKPKSTSLSLPCYSLPTFNIINNSLDQTTGPKRQVARDTRKTAGSRNFFFPIASENAKPISLEDSAPGRLLRGKGGSADPAAVHHLVFLPRVITAACQL